jgi:cysteine desulfurase/selenocysteine lyase
MTALLPTMATVRGEEDLRRLWVGVDQEVPVAGDRQLTYVNFDNAASTPPLRVVRDGIDGFLEWYASVHRGAGFKSRLATAAYEEARDVVAGFVGADPRRDSVVFTKHTTESVNLLAAALDFGASDVVALSIMEHHSNQLPWRRRAEVAYVETDAAGRLDLDSLEDILRRHAGRVRVVALSAASNVTGFVNPIHAAATLAHQYGARIVIDAAQLVAHRPLDMGAADDPEHLDFVVFSGHKIYAPYGAGALVGPADILNANPPMLAGGGAVKVVTRTDVIWEDGPDRHEAGSPNVVGSVALGIALDAVERIGFERLERIENELTTRALTGLAQMPKVSVLGSADPHELTDRLGVISFAVEGIHHAFVAAVLANEWGIGVRNGCFCAHPYLMGLMGLSEDETAETRDRIAAGDKREVPGAARVSFAPYNQTAEVDRFLEGLGAIIEGRVSLTYHQDQATGDYDPLGFDPRWSDTFTIRAQETRHG